MTDTGVRYIRPSFWERVRLVWIFRNFSTLPQQVLSASHQHLLSSLCEARRMIRCGAREVQHARVIGTLLTTMLPEPGSAPERRSQSRAAMDFEVRYGMCGGALAACEGQDFSAGGMSFTGSKIYPPGTELELRYRLAGKEQWTKLRALVRHRDGDRMRVKFLSFRTDDGHKNLPLENAT
jgi:hypothetical protein